MEKKLNTEALAVQAIQQARLLTYQAELFAQVATAQAVTLLLDLELSHRQIAKLTGLSKSQVARHASRRPPLGVARSTTGEGRVYDFAADFIWGGSDVAGAVVDRLLTHNEDDRPTS